MTFFEFGKGMTNFSVLYSLCPSLWKEPQEEEEQKQQKGQASEEEVQEKERLCRRQAQG